METITASEARSDWSNVLSRVVVQRSHMGIKRNGTVQGVLVDPTFYERALQLMEATPIDDAPAA